MDLAGQPNLEHVPVSQKHLKSACSLLKISPLGVVQSQRTSLLTSEGFVSNSSKHQGNSGKQGWQQEQTESSQHDLNESSTSLIYSEEKMQFIFNTFLILNRLYINKLK